MAPPPNHLTKNLRNLRMATQHIDTTALSAIEKFYEQEQKDALKAGDKKSQAFYGPKYAAIKELREKTNELNKCGDKIKDLEQKLRKKPNDPKLISQLEAERDKAQVLAEETQDLLHEHQETYNGIFSKVGPAGQKAFNNISEAATRLQTSITSGKLTDAPDLPKDSDIKKIQDRALHFDRTGQLTSEKDDTKRTGIDKFRDKKWQEMAITAKSLGVKGDQIVTFPKKLKVKSGTDVFFASKEIDHPLAKFEGCTADQLFDFVNKFNKECGERQVQGDKGPVDVRPKITPILNSKGEVIDVKVEFSWKDRLKMPIAEKNKLRKQITEEFAQKLKAENKADIDPNKKTAALPGHAPKGPVPKPAVHKAVAAGHPLGQQRLAKVLRMGAN